MPIIDKIGAYVNTPAFKAMNDHKFQAVPSFLIKEASRELCRQAEASMRPLGLGMASLPVLVALKDGLAVTQAELARLLHVEQPSMAQTLARLERDHLIRRTPDPSHKRTQIVELTDLARERLPRARAILAGGNTKALVGFSEKEVTMFTEFLQRVIVNLDEKSSG